MRRTALATAAVALALAACGGGSMSGESLFPEDYEATYQEVRDCRQSGGAHDLNHIRVLADPAALGPYSDRTTPFPVGAVVLKEEYDIADATCSGEVIQWSVMAKLEDGADPEMLDWTWQRVDRLGEVVEQDAPRCAGCHQGCGFPPDGYDGTCTVP